MLFADLLNPWPVAIGGNNHATGTLDGFANEGSDLKTLVKLVDDHGTNVLSQAVNSLTSIDNADYVISTAHKAKGLEWGRVQLDDDFYYDVTTNAVKISPEELRLLYVACTRAQSNLDIHHIKDLIIGLQTGKKVIFGNT